MATESDLIRRYRGAFTKEQCKDIISHINYFEEHSLMFYDKKSLHNTDHITVNVAHQWDMDETASSKMSNLVLPHLKPCVDEYLKAFSVLNDYKFLMYDIKVKKIPIGGGFHSWHFETGGIENCHRVFVVQLYVNDDFEGGETEFLYQNRREEAVAGDVLIFPAGFTHTHRGNPPIAGHKYLITSWGHMQKVDG